MTSFLNHKIPFPQTLPAGFHSLEEPVRFDPNKHLALEAPQETLTLEELGYSREEIALCPTNLAVASPVRLLSEEGVQALLAVARTLRQFSIRCERIENMVRCGVYQSKFLQDFCLSPQVTDFLSEIYQTTVAPHTMPAHLGHLNFAPDDLNKAVDKWHHDTLGLDYVLMVSNPQELSGGEFQYFLGTKQEAATLWEKKQPIPEERIVSPHFPGAGYALVLQGNMVVHRAAKLHKLGERITLVNGYVPLKADVPDACRFNDLKQVDPHHILFPEWARHKAWLARGKLDQLIEELPFTDDPTTIIEALKNAIVDVESAIEDLQDESEGTLIHYGG